MKRQSTTKLLVDTCSLIGIILSIFPTSNTLDIHSFPQEFCYKYKSCGPNSEQWTGTCNNGTRQSPINLIFSKRHQPKFSFIPFRYLRADFFFIQNNGHTINLNFPILGPGFFPGYGLSKHKYKFSNVHFHWSDKDDSGSEHFIDGQSFSMEMHFVHYKHKYKSLRDAISSGSHNAVAVVAIFLQVSENAEAHPAFAPVIKNLEKIQDRHSYWEKVDENLDFTSLVPRTDEWMYHYKGSLTTPGCNERVNWYVFENPNFIARSDVEAFRSIRDGNGEPLLQNHRPLQPDMGRRIDIVMLE